MSQLLRKLIPSLIIYSCFTISPLAARVIHALIAADTTTKVKYSSKEDIRYIHLALEKIAKETGMRLNLTTAKGKKLEKKKINRWFRTVKPGSDDIVFFYFTGHGFRISDSNSKWPQLFFPSSRNTKKMTFYINKLKEKKARLNIVLCDCCNNDINPEELYISKGVPDRPMPQMCSFRPPQGYKKLFLETSGFIIASGAVPGKPAWTTKSGGLFTLSFLRSLQRETNKHNPTWHRIFEQASILCNIMQQPQYRLFINEKKHRHHNL